MFCFPLQFPGFLLLLDPGDDDAESVGGGLQQIRDHMQDSQPTIPGNMHISI